MSRTIAIGIIGGLIIAGASFYVGTRYNPYYLLMSMSPSTTVPFASSTPPGLQKTSKTVATSTPAYTNVVGTFVSVQPFTSLTLKLADGSTKTFPLSASTPVLATVATGQTAPRLSTLPVGTMVALTIATAADGTVTVRSVNILVSSPAPATKK